MSIVDHDGAELKFATDDLKTVAAQSTAQTSVKGPGSYRLRLSNCDHELLLWVNGNVVRFDGPTTYDSDDFIEPAWSPSDFGDLEPAGVGSQGAAVTLSALRIYRDKYYSALDERTGEFEYGGEFYVERMYGHSPSFHGKQQIE